MTHEVFNYKPAPGAKRRCKPNVNATKFGDGYELRVAQGINSTPVTWDLSFPEPNITAVDAFLTARAGVEAFTWTDPRGLTGVWVCREWDVTHVSVDIYTLNATFEQVFEA